MRKVCPCHDVTDYHYNDVIMGGVIASQITRLTSVYSTVYSGADQRKHQSSASLAFVLGIHRGPVNSPHKWPVRRKCFHLMTSSCLTSGGTGAWRSTDIIQGYDAATIRKTLGHKIHLEKTSATDAMHIYIHVYLYIFIYIHI